jgi:predicted RNA-binding protein with PIN domain
MRLIVDGMNVIGSRPDGWWRDRAGAKLRLAERLATLAEAYDGSIEVVFDGRPLPALPAGQHDGIEVRYATRSGRDAADDRIVDLVHEAADRAGICVVTSDRALRDRVRTLGASIRSSGDLLADLDA